MTLPAIVNGVEQLVLNPAWYRYRSMELTPDIIRAEVIMTSFIKLHTATECVDLGISSSFHIHFSTAGFHGLSSNLYGLR